MPVYLKYGDIKGDVKEADHVDWIELSSTQLGAFQHRRREPTGHTITEVTATKAPDRSSPELQRAAISGSAVTAVIDFVESDGHVYLRLEMKNALISSFTFSGGSDNPMETLTLNFTEIEYQRR